jgi:hypothetical protein
MLCLLNLYIARKYSPSMTNPVAPSIESKDIKVEQTAATAIAPTPKQPNVLKNSSPDQGRFK